MKRRSISTIETANQYMMKRHWLAAVSSCALLTVVSKFFGGTLEQMSWMLLGLVAMIGLIATYFSRVAANTDELLAKRHRELVKMFEQIAGKHITYDLFGVDSYYEKIRDKIWEAIKENEGNSGSVEVWLSSFRSANPVSDPETPESKKMPADYYHSDLRKWIEAGSISVRRIISVSKADKLNWVLDLVKTMAIPGYEMNLQRGALALRTDARPSINIQLIGDSHIFIVICGEKADSGDKFIYFRSKAFHALLKEHYNNLWHHLSDYSLVRGSSINKGNLNALFSEFGRDFERDLASRKE